MACRICGSASHPSAAMCPQEDKSFRNIQMAPSGFSDKETDRQLRMYEKAVAEGHQPWGTSVDRKTGYLHSEIAMAVADHTGVPYRAEDMVGSAYPEYKDHIRPLSADEKKLARESARQSPALGNTVPTDTQS